MLAHMPKVRATGIFGAEALGSGIKMHVIQLIRSYSSIILYLEV